MTDKQNLEERTQQVIELAKKHALLRSEENLERDAKKFEERLPDVPPRDITGKRQATTVHHKCWFFRDEKYNTLTVEECIQQYKHKMYWAYENLQINWSKCVDNLMYENCEAVKWTQEYQDRKDRLLMMGYRLDETPIISP
tara:strand:- start:1336 stop:1758 length:423 start_codon:yes stop_codon:yes gene_type:complete